MTDFSNIDFTVTDEPPTVKRTGRRGSNPFVEPLLKSYEGDFAASNEWYKFTVDVNATDEPKREVDRAIDRIRAAGQGHNPKIGTEVRRDYDTGVVAFRGVPWMPRKAAGGSETSETSEDAGRHALNGDPYQGVDE